MGKNKNKLRRMLALIAPVTIIETNILFNEIEKSIAPSNIINIIKKTN